MKKILSIMLLFVLLTGALVGFSACNDDKTKENKSSSSTESSNSIVGSWKYEGGGYIYTFKEDGTGIYDISGTKMEFTYELKDGNKIAILYKGSTAPFETEYKIDGDTLNVIDSLGRDTLYKKVK